MRRWNTEVVKLYDALPEFIEAVRRDVLDEDPAILRDPKKFKSYFLRATKRLFQKVKQPGAAEKSALARYSQLRKRKGSRTAVKHFWEKEWWPSFQSEFPTETIYFDKSLTWPTRKKHRQAFQDRVRALWNARRTSKRNIGEQ